MTSTGADLRAFARLIESLTPWLDQVVIIGGWSHRLHRLHPAAQTLNYAPLTTLDADVALPIELKVEGQDIYQRLQANGFQAQFLGEHKPPSTHYHLTAERGEFYAEFRRRGQWSIRTTSFITSSSHAWSMRGCGDFDSMTSATRSGAF
jgi:hypothetical protein